MQSLRTGKASQPRQKPSQRPQVKLAKSPSRAARKSRVDDKIKKRLSMRYADISAPTGATGVPDVPSLPIDVRPAAFREQDEVVQDRSAALEDPKAADRKILDQEEFNPDAYLKIKLANSTEAELRSLQSSLRGLKDDTHTDLQRNVFKNYAEFVLISKEIGTLENEMLELKESLAEWKGMPSVLHIDESASAAERRRHARSSVADLRILYANQMQTLHAQVEGSSKFAPTTPGRHVVLEMDGIFALNAATYKIDHAVRFIVLDDAVLVAKRRRRRNAGGEGSSSAGRSAQGKLMAERCWPLSEMLVLDTKDSASITNVFKIRHAKETHVYRTEIASDKKSLLSQFRQVAEELAAKKRKEREGEHERRKTLWGDRNSLAIDKVPPIPDWMASLNQRSGVDNLGTKDKAERDARWVGEWSDDLTVAISLKEWEKAVTFVEQGKAKVSTTPLLATKLPSQTASLTNALLQSLSSSTNRKSDVVGLISWLVRLQAGPAARNTFFKARTEAIRRYIRAIRFEGHIGMFIGDLAIVVFTGIKHTADWFLASFRENEVASSFIDWAKKQIEAYAETFRKQVYSSDVDPKTIEEALKITHSQSKKLLQEYGLDFRFLLDNLLAEHPKEPKKSEPPFTFRGQVQRPDPIVPPPPSSASVFSMLSPPPNSARLATPSSATIPQGRLLSPLTPGAITTRFHSPAQTPNASPATSYAPPLPSVIGLPSTPSRPSARTPVSALPFAGPAPTSPLPSVVSPVPRRMRSSPPPIASATRNSGMSSLRGPRPARTSASGSPVPRSSAESPAPPPRSTNRPGSSHRPPPVAVPKREGMI